MKAFYLLLVVMFFMPLVNASAGVVSSNLPLAKHIRAVHFVLRAVPYESGIKIVDMASQAGMNTIVVQITDGVRLEHAPWSARKDAWRKDELKQWATYAKSKGISIVPELKLLTHQEKLFQNNYPHLMFNKKTYDPRQPEVYERIFPLIDEVIDLLQPEAMHIGHDEIAGFARWWWPKWLNKNEKMLPADLFYLDTILLYQHLKNKRITTWMWGDMLLAPQDFPTMRSNHLHARRGGYGQDVRNYLPKDIVICDWHYADKNIDFPSLKVMQQEGFRVIGSAFRNKKTTENFSRYAAEHGAYGMMATTWFHVQRKEWDVVDRIISFSGKTFLKDFPNEK